MLLKVPDCPTELFKHFSDMERLNSILRDYEVVATGTAWEFGSLHDVEDLSFVVERQHLAEDGVQKLEQFLFDEGYTAEGLDDDTRSFSKEDGTIQVHYTISSDNALTTVFDSGEVPYDFEMTRFWRGIYGVYSEDLMFLGSRQFVYRSCEMDIASMKSLETKFNIEVAQSVLRALAREQARGEIETGPKTGKLLR